ncbi:SusD/RagB family nutrient-binding outer membrane lipoprotein [Flavobacteriaceae bacterium]|nr:SusD/RagB family nutrient-binding outer membrane lipoprotein [Flavobacteriaceae bacterium]
MKLYKFILPIFAVLAIASCESYTEDLNDDPNAFVVASSDLIIGQVQLALMQHMGSNNARYAAVFNNQMSGGDRQYLTLNTYSPNRANYNDMWNDTYIAGINNAQLIINDEKASDLIKGIAQILQGTMFADMALLYGDVPFSQAVQPNEFSEPAYDAQATVVSGGISLIESGITKVGAATIAAGYGGARLEGGTWAEAGHTLAARYALASGNNALAISHANQGISSRANDLVTQHGNAQYNRNLMYQFVIDQRQDYLVATDSHLANLLDGTVDRALTTPGNSLIYASYFLADGTPGDPSYRTLINTNDGGRYGQTASMPIATYYENQLILAEAKLGSDDAGARGHLNNVRTALAAEYGSDATAFPASSSTGAALKMEVLEEKYITLIGELVAFHDLRRTGNYIGVPNKLTGDTSATGYPQRFLYPQNEVDTNSNVPSPLPTFFQTTSLF